MGSYYWRKTPSATWTPSVPPKLLQGPLKPPLKPSFTHAFKMQMFFTNIVTFKCPRGKVCVLLLKITNLKAKNTSLNPFNLLKEVPSTFWYARCQMVTNFFLLFVHLNSQVIQWVYLLSLYKISTPYWPLETLQMTPCTSHLTHILKSKVKQWVHVA